MNRITQLLFIVLTLLPVTVMGQDTKNYLVGAVPEVDGKVVFSRHIEIPGKTKDQIYDVVLGWMQDWMKKNDNNSRVVYTDRDKGIIAGTGEEYIVFTSTSLSLDRTVVNYQLTATIQAGKCSLEMEKIKFTYNEKEKYTAEEWISDEVALNKARTKMVRGLVKFRTKTVDFADNMFDNAQLAMAKAFTVPVAPVVVATSPNVTSSLVVAVPSVPVATVSVKPDVSTIPAEVKPVITHSPTSEMEGYKSIAPDRIPGNIIKMLTDDWMLITAGTSDKFNMMTASWGGLGTLYGKPIAICFINPARYTYQLMETSDTYTFTFYTEAYRDALNYCGSHSGRNEDKVKGSGLTPVTTPSGSKAFSEAWMIIECRKLVSQSLTPEAIANPEIKGEWAGKAMHKMYIGEIINVWVK